MLAWAACSVCSASSGWGAGSSGCCCCCPCWTPSAAPKAPALGERGGMLAAGKAAEAPALGEGEERGMLAAPKTAEAPALGTRASSLAAVWNADKATETGPGGGKVTGMKPGMPRVGLFGSFGAMGTKWERGRTRAAVEGPRMAGGAPFTLFVGGPSSSSSLARFLLVRFKPGLLAPSVAIGMAGEPAKSGPDTRTLFLGGPSSLSSLLRFLLSPFFFARSPPALAPPSPPAF
jgi:hypothetical protein